MLPLAARTIRPGSTTLKETPSRARLQRTTEISVALRPVWGSHGPHGTGGKPNMAHSRFRTGVALRTAGLALTIVAVAWMIAQTRWYVTISLVLAAALAQIFALV